MKLNTQKHIKIDIIYMGSSDGSPELLVESQVHESQNLLFLEGGNFIFGKVKL